ncbi:MAG TPA: hypothetical protein VLM83_08990 [Anaerolineales bacterium]|nr:hypothetical protein [Anaerolineales bacterium]
MDDRFLYQLQEQPDVEFAKTLHRKLVQLHPESTRWLDMNPRNLINNKKLVQVTALFVIAVIAVMAISPARALVSSFITNIAGQVFEVTDDYPGDNYTGEVEIIEPQVMSLTEALAVFPYDISMPTAIPSECVLDEDHVLVYVGEDAGPFANSMEFNWLSSKGGCFRLRITDEEYWSNGEIVAPDAVEEISLGSNLAAVLIRGGWDADHKVWSNEHGVRLRWPLGDLMYELMGTDQEQLIEIATSTLE